MKDAHRRLKDSSKLPIITPVITAVFGLVGGKLLETSINSVLDTTTRIVLAGFFLCGLLSTIVLVVVTLFGRRAEERELAWIQTIGIPAEIAFEHADKSSGVHFKKLTELVRGASEGDEILIMTTHRPTTPIDDAPKSNEHFIRKRESYCNLLLRKAKESGITYRRIICFDNCTTSDSLDAGCVKPWLIDHCRDMLKIKASKPDKISVTLSARKFGADIFVIPGKIGVILLDVYDSKTSITTTNATLFFHYPSNENIIEELRAWFKVVQNQAGAVSLSEIP